MKQNHNMSICVLMQEGTCSATVGNTPVHMRTSKNFADTMERPKLRSSRKSVLELHTRLSYCAAYDLKQVVWQICCVVSI
jgi:hypothetical protein